MVGEGSRCQCPPGVRCPVSGVRGRGQDRGQEPARVLPWNRISSYYFWEPKSIDLVPGSADRQRQRQGAGSRRVLTLTIAAGVRGCYKTTMAKRRNSNPNAAPDRAANPCFTADGQPVPSLDLFDVVDRLQEGDRRVILSFSGKDSLAAWLYLREHGFEVIPYWCYSVPGLSFDDEMLDYYESFFGTHIYRFLHPATYKLLDALAWQPPDAVAPILRLNIQRGIDFTFLEQLIIDAHSLRPDTFTVVGIRASDNLMRNRLVHQMGPLGLKHRRYWWAVWDFKMDDVLGLIHKYQVKLSKAYTIWGSTGDIWDYHVLKTLKEKAPADYSKIVQMFPLIEAEFFRYEAVQ